MMLAQEASALSALGMTIMLVLSRPRIGERLVVGPALAALAGVVLMHMAGHVALADIREAAAVLWRPLIAIASIMVIAAAAGHIGVIDRLAATVLLWADGSADRLLLLVFGLSALTAAILNNDVAILILTPTVVVLVRQLYPQRPGLAAPFAFTVFMAAGVAPLVTSNPMNLIVADFADLNFNAYAVRMIPVALFSSAATFLVLRTLFRRELAHAGPARPAATAGLPSGRWRSAERHGLLLVVTVLGAYPVVAYFGGAVWLVAATGAAASVLLCARYGAVSPRRLLADGVSWQILAFLLGMFMLAIGLRNAGAVGWLSSVYASANIITIGVVSALGSALINNHSMALINLLAIEGLPGSRHIREFLAILVGGDLGPRLLPTGSLAGLMWFAVLERMGVTIPLRQFVAVGIIVTLPSLAIALVVLAFTT